MADIQHHRFHYVELPSTDNAAMKAFYGGVFGWTFQDYGPTYVAIHGAGVEGGFDADSDRKPSDQGALVIIYSKDLEASEEAAKDAGGDIPCLYSTSRADAVFTLKTRAVVNWVFGRLLKPKARRPATSL